jgi:hypothetical protein
MLYEIILQYGHIRESRSPLARGSESTLSGVPFVTEFPIQMLSSHFISHPTRCLKHVGLRSIRFVVSSSQKTSLRSRRVKLPPEDVRVNFLYISHHHKSRGVHKVYSLRLNMFRPRHNPSVGGPS